MWPTRWPRHTSVTARSKCRRLGTGTSSTSSPSLPERRSRRGNSAWRWSRSSDGEGSRCRRSFDVPDRSLWGPGYAAQARRSLLTVGRTLDEALAYSPSVSRSVARQDSRRIVEPRGSCLDRVAASSSQDEGTGYRSVIMGGLSYNFPTPNRTCHAAGRGPCREVPLSAFLGEPPHEQGPLARRSSNIPPPPLCRPGAASWLCPSLRLQSPS